MHVEMAPFAVYLHHLELLQKIRKKSTTPSIRF